MSIVELRKINSDFAKPLDDLIDELIGTSADTANSSGTLHAKTRDIRNYLTTVYNAANASPVRSVQRGIAVFDQDVMPLDVWVTISSVNTAKAFLLFSVSVSSNSSIVPGFMFRGQITSSTNIAFSREFASQLSGATIAWQVIEFR